MFKIYVNDQHYQTVDDVWQLFKSLYQVFGEFGKVRVQIDYAG